MGWAVEALQQVARCEYLWSMISDDAAPRAQTTFIRVWARHHTLTPDTARCICKEGCVRSLHGARLPCWSSPGLRPHLRPALESFQVRRPHSNACCTSAHQPLHAFADMPSCASVCVRSTSFVDGSRGGIATGALRAHCFRVCAPARQPASRSTDACWLGAPTRMLLQRRTTIIRSDPHVPCGQFVRSDRHRRNRRI